MILRKAWIPSPFFSNRGNYPLDMIVIHHIGSNNGKIYSAAGAVTWFTNIEAHRNKSTGAIENKVSAHYIIARSPYQNQFDIVQLVKDFDVAWHAGDSSWSVYGKTRKYINNYSIGIELEGDGNAFEYTDYQYEVLADLTKELMKAHSIPENNIVGHEDIAPQRKVDPGRLFDWKRYRSLLVAPEVQTSVASVPERPIRLPDTEFHMQGGENKIGKIQTNIFYQIIQIITKIFVK